MAKHDDLKKELHKLGIKTYKHKVTQALYVKRDDVKKVLAGVENITAEPDFTHHPLFSREKLDPKQKKAMVVKQLFDNNIPRLGVLVETLNKDLKEKRYKKIKEHLESVSDLATGLIDAMK